MSLNIVSKIKKFHFQHFLKVVNFSSDPEGKEGVPNYRSRKEMFNLTVCGLLLTRRLE